MAEIWITDPAGKISHFSLTKDEIHIGRQEGNDIVLQEVKVSRKHAKIVKKEDKYIVVDLGSSNGTKVNGEAVTEKEITPDDHVEIGETRISLIISERAQIDPTQTIIDEGQSGSQLHHVQKSFLDGSCENMMQSLLIPVGLGKKEKKSKSKGSKETQGSFAIMPQDLSALERSNKVLYVLFEISRQMVAIYDFHQLLQSIMDHIFDVIEADAGFVFLKDQLEQSDPQPAIVKFKQEGKHAEIGRKASRTILNRVVLEEVALLFKDSRADSSLAQIESLISQNIISSLCVPLWSKDEIIGVIQLNSSRFDKPFTEDDLELLKTIGCQMAMVVEQSRLNEKLRKEEQLVSRLQRFHSPQVIELILQSSRNDKEDFLQPKELSATILFTDIVNFTTISEKIPPREVNLILNLYFDEMTKIIFELEGTLDKYLGDGLMAVFGAPIQKPDDAERAVTAAMRMRRKLPNLFKERGIHQKFDIRIGIQTGNVVAGNLGSEMRMDYTVIGDTVNTASRLESLADPNQIIIGDKTFEQVKNKFNINLIGPRKLKGKSQEVTIYEVLD